LLRPNGLGFLVLGLMLLAVACSPTVGGPQAAADVGEPPTLTQVARTDVTATSAIAEPVESAPAGETPAPTSTTGLPTATPEVEATLTVTLGASVVDPTAEIKVTSMERLTVLAETESDSVAQDQAQPGPGPTQEQLELLAGLQSYGPAPELHNEVWLNSEPLNLADLRGQVVMVEFWTFG
jgi:hypothetical protein